MLYSTSLVSSGISVVMLRARWVWLVLGAAVIGCASDDASDGAGIDYGGQTGSLLPPGQCQVPAAHRGELVVAEGTVAFVAHAGSESTLQATLVDESGRSIDLDFDPLESGTASAATSDEVLTPGTYQVDYVCQSDEGSHELSVDLRVEPAAPLPIELGELSFESGSAPDCRRDDVLEMELSLSDESRAFSQLLEIWVSVEEQRPFVVAHYGTLSADDATSILRIARCVRENDVECIPARAVDVVFSATIAGEAMATQPVALTLDATCTVAEPAERELSCSSEATPMAPNRWVIWFGLGLAVAMRRVRREIRR